MTVPIPSNEHERLLLLRELDLLDSAPEPTFDRITQLAADMLDVPIALVSLIDDSRQWFKSRVGLEVVETPRNQAFCAYAILQDEPLVVNDARFDQRFADNPLVVGEPNIRFYAGVPLLSSEGFALGTLCVIDRIPRQLSDKQLRILRNLADLVQREIISRELVNRARTASRESQRIIIESDRRFRATFEQAAVGIAIVGTDGRWLQVNQKLCDIVGYSAQELMPLTFQQITHPDDLDNDLSLVQQLLDGRIDSYALEKRYIRKSGEPVWIHLSVSLMRDEMGKPLQFISVIEDVDARKQAEQALRRLRLELERRVELRTEELQRANALLTDAMQAQLRSQASLVASECQLRAVLENAQDAYVSIDQDGLIAHWNRQAELTFGWSREEAVGRRLDETIIPAEFREAHRQGMKRFLGQGEARVLNKRLELSALRRDGSIFPVEVRISPLPAVSGHLFCAFLHDISERKRREEALRSSQQQLQTIANNLPIQIAYIDAEQRVRFINDTYRVDTGLTPELAFGKRLQEILKPTFYQQVSTHIDKALAGERVIFETATRFRGKEQVWGTVYIPDTYAGKVHGFYIMSQDITARKKLEHSLLDKATRDALTGLPNRAALLERLQVATQRAAQQQEKLALLFLDLDGFKGVNDQYGHDGGDEVLRQFSKRLTASVRSSDMVARLAGDEFVILLEGLHGDEVAERLAEKILAAMRQPFELGVATALLGSSIGLYIHEPDAPIDIDRMLAGADQAMYEAKRQGKNQLRRFKRN